MRFDLANYIIEHKFETIWMTMLACLLGGFLYFRIPVELLPSTQEMRYAIFFPVERNLSANTTAQIDEAIRQATKRLGISGSVLSETTRLKHHSLFVPKPSRTIPEYALQKAVSEQLKQNGINTIPTVVEIDPKSGSLLTLLIQTEQSQTDLDQLQIIRNRVIRPILEIDGVAAVSGIDDESVEISPNPAYFFQTGKTLSEQIQTLSSALQPNPLHQLSSGDLIELQEVNPIKTQNTTAPFLTAPKVPMILSRKDNKPAYLLSVYKSLDANEIAVSDRIHETIKQTTKELSKIDISFVNDKADYIRSAETNVINNLRDGIILTCFCILLFVRNLRYTILSALSIPISLALVFPLMWFFGISRNIMSLAGLALSVGVVVDATISVINGTDENLALGFPPSVATRRAIHENFVPVSLAVATTISVFVPILFLPGMAGDIFSDLSITVIISQIVGTFVALVFIPCLLVYYYSARGRKVTKSTTSHDETSQAKIQESGLLRYLEILLAKPTFYWGTTLLFFTGIICAIALAPATEFLPKPRHALFRTTIQTENIGAEQKIIELEQRLDKHLTQLQATERLITYQAPILSAEFRLAKSPQSIDAFAKEIGSLVAPYPATVAISNPIDEPSSQGIDLEFFTRSDNPKREQLISYLKSRNGITSLSASGDFHEALAIVHPAQTTWTGALLPQATIPTWWSLFFGATTLGYAPWNTNSGHVLWNFRSLLQDSQQHPTLATQFPANPYFLIQEMRREPATSIHLDGESVERFRATVQGKTSGQVAAEIESFAQSNQIALKWDYSRMETARSIHGMIVCVAIAIVLIFFILLAQNRSIAATSIIMFTFLWGSIGVFPGLVVHGETLNASALVGIILLGGTIVNNGILLMDRIIKYRARQMDPKLCCLIAVRERSIPVLVTALTTAFGMIPMVFETGAGSQMYRGLSIVVVYGTLVSTPISLIGIPCLVMIIRDVEEWFGRALLKTRIFAEVVFHRRESL